MELKPAAGELSDLMCHVVNGPDIKAANSELETSLVLVQTAVPTSATHLELMPHSVSVITGHLD